MPPELSIVIPAYNEESLLPSTLHSLQTALNGSGLVWEAIVCDNNSTDKTAETARAHGATVVFESHNQIARARNAGAQAARGRWLLFLDADTRINPRLAELLLQAFHSGKTGAGGALVRFEAGQLPIVPRFFITLWNCISRVSRIAAGSFIFCTREAWVETGGFDESFYAGEEIFFSLRLKTWCRKQGLAFKILPEPVLTSARKLHWHSEAKIWSALFRAAMPGAIKDRDRCAFWYKRPGEIKPMP